MKKCLLVFMLLNFISGCVEYNDVFPHDNGRKCGHREDHCGVGHQGDKNKHHDKNYKSENYKNEDYKNEDYKNENDKHENHQGAQDDDHDDNGKKGKKGKKKD